MNPTEERRFIAWPSQARWQLGADSLQRWLTDQDYPTERLASGRGFRVLEGR